MTLHTKLKKITDKISHLGPRLKPRLSLQPTTPKWGKLKQVNLAYFFNPYSIALLASVSAHVLVLAVLLPYSSVFGRQKPAQGEEDSTSVPVIALSPAEQTRLPDLSTPALDSASPFSRLLESSEFPSPRAFQTAPSENETFNDDSTSLPNTSFPRSSFPTITNRRSPFTYRFRRSLPANPSSRLPIPAPPPLGPGFFAPPPTNLPSQQLPSSQTPSATAPAPQNESTPSESTNPDLPPATDASEQSEVASNSSPPQTAPNPSAEIIASSSSRDVERDLLERAIATGDIRLLEKPDPKRNTALQGRYPSGACQQKLDGVVGFSFNLGPQGQVNSPRLVTSGHEILDQQAKQDLADYPFTNPSGQARPQNVTFSYRYDPTRCGESLPSTANTAEALGEEPIQPQSQPNNSPTSRTTQPTDVVPETTATPAPPSTPETSENTPQEPTNQPKVSEPATETPTSESNPSQPKTPQPKTPQSTTANPVTSQPATSQPKTPQATTIPPKTPQSNISDD